MFWVFARTPTLRQLNVNWIITTNVAGGLLHILFNFGVNVVNLIRNDHALWDNRGPICAVSTFTTILGGSVSLLVITVLAIKRFGFIVYNFEPSRTQLQCALAVVYLFSLLLSGIPIILNAYGPRPSATYCTVDWGQPAGRPFAILSLAYIPLCLVIVTVCYAAIFRKVWLVKNQLTQLDLPGASYSPIRISTSSLKGAHMQQQSQSPNFTGSNHTSSIRSQVESPQSATATRTNIDSFQRTLVIRTAILVATTVVTWIPGWIEILYEATFEQQALVWLDVTVMMCWILGNFAWTVIPIAMDPRWKTAMFGFHGQ
ncbi:hypothetical protein HK102_000121 [Quaeritorhiza haematococci]|nr:hypothetical protein HK102_000121 [Quaeritorhiza haematococci]